MCTYVWVFAHECSWPQGSGEGIRSPRTGGIGVCDVSCGCQKRTQSFKQWNHLISPKVWFHVTLLSFVCLFYIIFGLLHSKNTFKFMSFPSLHFFSCSWYVFKIFYFTLKRTMCTRVSECELEHRRAAPEEASESIRWPGLEFQVLGMTLSGCGELSSGFHTSSTQS